MKAETRVRRIVEMMAVGATIALAASFALGDLPTLKQWEAALFFTAFGALASGLSYRTSSLTTGNIGFLPFMSVALISPNVAALLAVVTGMLVGEAAIRREPIKMVFNTAQQVFSVAVAIGIFNALGGESALVKSPGLIPFICLVASYFAVNKLAVSTVVAASSGVSTSRHWLKSIRGSFVYDALSMPLIVVFAVAYARLGPAWTALLVLPTLGIRQLYRTVFVLEKVNEELLSLMVASIEARDPYTSGHSQRVARYARVIAERLGLAPRQVDRAVTAALLHDVGKIFEQFAPILRKPGRLTPDEFEIMKLHSVRGAELVGKVSHFADLAAVVRAHHEAWDGSGYPDHLAGKKIPDAARVIALADTIDAMTTSRPYRAAMSPEVVREEIQAQRGRQFDPDICDAILSPAAWRELESALVEASASFPADSWTSVGRTAEFRVEARSA
jgi:putative nucleotidyltransferase with HDIG domain